MKKLLILSAPDVHRLMPVADCIPVMEEALREASAGDAFQPLRSVMRPPGAAGLFGMMPSWRGGSTAAFGLKAICVIPSNPPRGLDAHQGAVLLFDGETGQLLAMADASAVTAIRTAAVTAVATRLLARPESSAVAIIGTGVQAHTHLEALHAVLRIEEVRVAGRVRDRADAFAEREGARYPFALRAADSAEEAVRGADVIVTVTSSKEPVLRREWIADGAHVNLIGSSTPDGREADSATLAAGTLFADRRESVLRESGEFIKAKEEGLVTDESISAEIGELLAGRAGGRSSPAEITIFKSLGLGIEDLATLAALHKRAQERNVGSWIPFAKEPQQAGG